MTIKMIHNWTTGGVENKCLTRAPRACFDFAELRLRPDATSAVAKLITESEPIRGLVG
jgi:hypothetical protein